MTELGLLLLVGAAGAPTKVTRDKFHS